MSQPEAHQFTPVVDTIADRSPMARALNLAAVYLGNPNISVNPDQIPDVVANCLKAITSATEPVELKADLIPAVPIKKSVTPDFIICLEDGVKFKSLKRHLRTHYNMTPDEYREKWGLPSDYPMVAPNYSATRSQLAKATGLGTKKK